MNKTPIYFLLFGVLVFLIVALNSNLNTNNSSYKETVNVVSPTQSVEDGNYKNFGEIKNGGDYKNYLISNLQLGDVTSSDCLKVWNEYQAKNVFVYSDYIYNYDKKRCLLMTQKGSLEKDKFVEMEIKDLISSQQIFYKTISLTNKDCDSSTNGNKGEANLSDLLNSVCNKGTYDVVRIRDYMSNNFEYINDGQNMVPKIQQFLIDFNVFNFKN